MKGRKLYAVIATVLLATALLVSVLVIMNKNKTEKTKELDKKTASVQETLQQPDGSCSESNKKDLSDIYEKTADSNSKGLYAEQLATCYVVAKDYAQSIDWYTKAKDSYDKGGDQQKVANMQKAVEHSEFLRDLNPITVDESQNAESGEGQGQ